MPARVQVNLHEAAIQVFFERHFGREMRAIVREGVRLSRARTPRHRGDLARSVQGDVERYGAPDGGYLGYWGSDEPHAIWVHDGTGIYGPRRRPIRPTHGRFLVFTPYRMLGPNVFRTARGKIPAKQRRKIAVTSVRGQPRTPFLTEPFEQVLAAHGLAARQTSGLALRRLPSAVRGDR